VRPTIVRTPTAPTTADAMTRDAFLDELAPILRASDRFDLTHPAGRKVEADLTPVPLRMAPGAPANDGRGVTR